MKKILLGSSALLLCATFWLVGGGDRGGAPSARAAAAFADERPAPLDAGKEGTLENYMKTKVKAAMGAGDIAKVKEALKKVPGFAPEPAWNEGATGWKAIVDAATTADGNVGKACKTCHENWQKKYKATYADRILPK
ncbi:MAG TPA: hypothetical protein VG389_08525 [Myxococcota bacterium]|jgi:hypothetical protein|nr:hypothetical protein [Myxococcota bacterium]